MQHISKSDYLKFRIHPAYLWYQKNARNKLPKPGPNEEYVFEQGNQFEELVQRTFKNDIAKVQGDPWQYDELTRQTAAFIESGATTIFQASFMTQDRLFCRSDVIERVEGGWILSEIKSSTSVKQSHIYDVAFQRHILEQLGLKVVACRVLHVNKYYRRKPEISPESITAVRDITEQVDAIAEIVSREIEQAQTVIEQAEVDDHPAYAGNLGEWLNIYNYLHNVPEDSVLNFAQLKPQQARAFYEAGIERIQDAPINGLSEKQRIQQQAWQQEQPIVDINKIKNFLDELSYPLYFLDYETSAHVLPLYEKTRPYQQVPFQYSLHILRAPSAELEHYEYLHEELSLPAAELSKKLISEIGTTGTVLAWFDKFEKYCNRTMAGLAPDYEEQLHAINQRMLDLRIPFANYGYVHKMFNGSTSIKNVLPVMVPELSYKTLGIQEGGAAQRSWQQAVGGDRNSEKSQIFNDLLEYCKLDTLAMVEIFYRLLEIVGDESVPLKQSFEQEAMF